MVQSDFGNAGTNIFGQPQSGQALGTGFVVDQNGYILTNAHVVQDQGQKATSVTVVFNKGAGKTQQVKGQIVGIDSGSDVAVIKVDPAGVNLQPLPLGDSAKVQVGENVVAIGNPLGYDFSITSGIVSAIGRSLQAPNGMTIPNGIQTDAAINPGNSGGPLIDSTGHVIGINEQIASQSGGNQGLGFAVPINTAIRSLNQLKNGGTVKYAWLGVAGQIAHGRSRQAALRAHAKRRPRGEGLPQQPGRQGRHQGRRQVDHRPGSDLHGRRRRHRQGRRHSHQQLRRPHRLPGDEAAGRQGHAHDQSERPDTGHHGDAGAAPRESVVTGFTNAC